MTPHRAGELAWTRGWPRAANPFLPAYFSHEQWDEGWTGMAYLAKAQSAGGPGAHGWTKAGQATGAALIKCATEEMQ